MRDFPVFTTEYGAASLVLKEVPYRGAAYIIIHDSAQPEELLRECVAFCKMCGAERIYARGHIITEDYPLHCRIYEMRGQICVDEAKVEHLWPVTKENVSRWRLLMNERLRNVDHAATLEKKDEEKILGSCGAYFVHSNGELLGAGWLAEGELKLVAACKPGAGERVCHTLFSLTGEGPIRLEVASTNEKAIRLYEKLGFVRVCEPICWYQVL